MDAVDKFGEDITRLVTESECSLDELLEILTGAFIGIATSYVERRGGNPEREILIENGLRNVTVHEERTAAKGNTVRIPTSAAEARAMVLLGDQFLVNAARDQLKADPHAGDWPEDFPHENGNYYCHCLRCGSQFVGYKRRLECKVCTTLRTTS